MTSNKNSKVKMHFKKVDQVIYKAMENFDFDRWIKQHEQKSSDGSNYFRRLCREIVGQQLSGASANAINKRFQGLFDKKIIDPNRLVRMRDQTIRNVGMSWAKVAYVKNIARAYLTKTVQFSKLNNLEDEEVIDQLTSIKGIGNWTAEMFLIFTLGREDVFSHGDLGLRKGFSKLYKIVNPSKDQIEKVTQKWKPYRTYGSLTLWHALDI